MRRIGIRMTNLRPSRQGDAASAPHALAGIAGDRTELLLDADCQADSGHHSKSWILLPLWSEVVDTPKVFYPDKPKPADAARPVNLQPVLPAEKREALVEALVKEPTAAGLLRDIRRSRIRRRIWIGLATAQVLFLAWEPIVSFVRGIFWKA